MDDFRLSNETVGRILAGKAKVIVIPNGQFLETWIENEKVGTFDTYTDALEFGVLIINEHM